MSAVTPATTWIALDPDTPYLYKHERSVGSIRQNSIECLSCEFKIDIPKVVNNQISTIYSLFRLHGSVCSGAWAENDAAATAAAFLDEAEHRLMTSQAGLTDDEWHHWWTQIYNHFYAAAQCLSSPVPSLSAQIRRIGNVIIRLALEAETTDGSDDVRRAEILKSLSDTERTQ